MSSLQQFQRAVSAGLITTVTAAGCTVQNADGTTALLVPTAAMLAVRTPVVGDYWLVDGGAASTVAAADFAAGYSVLTAAMTSTRNLAIAALMQIVQFSRGADAITATQLLRDMGALQ